VKGKLQLTNFICFSFKVIPLRKNHLFDNEFVPVCGDKVLDLVIGQ
jgi:hypothetical protein